MSCVKSSDVRDNSRVRFWDSNAIIMPRPLFSSLGFKQYFCYRRTHFSCLDASKSLEYLFLSNPASILDISQN